MVKRYISTEFGISLLTGFLRTRVLWTTTDGRRPRDDSSYAVQKHKAELRNQKLLRRVGNILQEPKTASFQIYKDQTLTPGGIYCIQGTLDT